jgi:hypothetical protein
MNDIQCLVKFPSHYVRITVEDDVIHCFKYNKVCCDFDTFTDQNLAGDYILEPLPTIYYRVTTSDE